ncbi:hypothetical protein BJP27_24330 (plasmid) [Pseudomonas oryzihabitans]|nr:hypothetical protein BJP27_24330 [Pseudomonas psychrotolerans]
MGLRNLFGLLGPKAADYESDQLTRQHIGRAYGPAAGATVAPGHLLLVVVASGAYRAHTVIVHAIMGRNADRPALHRMDVQSVESLGVIEPSQVADRIAHTAQALPGVQVLVNTGGQGVTVARLLSVLCVSVRRFNWAEACTNPEFCEGYRNVKAQAYDRMIEAFHQQAITFQCEPPLYLYEDARRIGRRVVDGVCEFAPNELVGQYEGVDVLDALALAYIDGVTWRCAPTRPAVVAGRQADARRTAAADITARDDRSSVDSMGLASPLHPLSPFNQSALLAPAEVPRREDPAPVRCEPDHYSPSDYSGSHSSSYDSGSCSSSYSSSSDSSSSCSSNSSCD